MSSRLIITALAVSLLSFTCIAKSPDVQRATGPTNAFPLAVSESALGGESTRPITCGAALKIARQHYQNVEVQNCFGSEYSFRATTGHFELIVLVDPKNGRLWQGKILR